MAGKADTCQLSVTEFPESLFLSPDSETDTDQVWVSSPIPIPVLYRA